MSRHSLTGSGAQTPQQLASQAQEGARKQPRAPSSDGSLPGSGQEAHEPREQETLQARGPTGPAHVSPALQVEARREWQPGLSSKTQQGREKTTGHFQATSTWSPQRRGTGRPGAAVRGCNQRTAPRSLGAVSKSGMRSTEKSLSSAHTSRRTEGSLTATGPGSQGLILNHQPPSSAPRQSRSV